MTALSEHETALTLIAKAPGLIVTLRKLLSTRIEFWCSAFCSFRGAQTIVTTASDCEAFEAAWLLLSSCFGSLLALLAACGKSAWLRSLEARGALVARHAGSLTANGRAAHTSVDGRRRMDFILGHRRCVTPEAPNVL